MFREWSGLHCTAEECSSAFFRKYCLSESDSASRIGTRRSCYNQKMGCTAHSLCLPILYYVLCVDPYSLTSLSGDQESPRCYSSWPRVIVIDDRRFLICRNSSPQAYFFFHLQTPILGSWKTIENPKPGMSGGYGEHREYIRAA